MKFMLNYSEYFFASKNFPPNIWVIYFVCSTSVAILVQPTPSMDATQNAVINDITLLDEVFTGMDKNGDGKVEFYEFEAFYLKYKINVPANSIRAFFDELDKDKNGSVDIGELMEILPMYVVAHVCIIVIHY